MEVEDKKKASKRGAEVSARTRRRRSLEKEIKELKKSIDKIAELEFSSHFDCEMQTWLIKDKMDKIEKLVTKLATGDY